MWHISLACLTFKILFPLFKLSSDFEFVFLILQVVELVLVQCLAV